MIVIIFLLVSYQAEFDATSAMLKQKQADLKKVEDEIADLEKQFRSSLAEKEILGKTRGEERRLYSY